MIMPPPRSGVMAGTMCQGRTEYGRERRSFDAASSQCCCAPPRSPKMGALETAVGRQEKVPVTVGKGRHITHEYVRASQAPT